MLEDPIQSMITLLCFKVADLINVCDAASINLDLASRTLDEVYFDESLHGAWIRAFFESFTKVFAHQSGSVYAKVAEPLIRFLLGRSNE